MRTAMRLSTLSAPLASFAANSKPFFPLFFAWVSPLPPPARAKGGVGRTGSPTAPPDGACIKAMVVRRGGVWGELD